MGAHKSIFSILVSVTGIVLLAKVLGFCKQVVIANAFGATLHTDLISLSQGLVLDIDYVLIQALMTAFIPIYIGIKTKNETDAKKFVGNTVKSFFLITLAITCMIIFFSSRISQLLAPDYSVELGSRLAFYIKIMAPALIAVVLLAVFNALLKSNEHFLPGEFVSVNQSVVLIALVITLGSVWGPDTLIVAFYAYALISLLFLFFLSRCFVDVSYGNPFADSNIHSLLRMMGPLILGYSMVFVNQQVGRIIVSGLGEGTVTAMNYGAVLSNFVSTFLGTISGVMFTFVTQSIATQNDEQAAVLTTEAFINLIILMLPITIITAGNATDIVTIVYKRGAFDNLAVIRSAQALQGYAFMFVPLVARELFSRLHYAYGDSKQPMVNSTVGVVFNIIFSIMLGHIYGVFGVALASSIAVLICGVLNIYTVSKINVHLQLGKVFNILPQLTIGTCLCVVVTLLGHKFLIYHNVFLRFGLIVCITLLCYFAVVYSVVKPFLVRHLKRK